MCLISHTFTGLSIFSLLLNSKVMYIFQKYLFIAYFKTVKAISPPAKAIAVSTGDGSLLSGELTISSS